MISKLDRLDYKSYLEQHKRRQNKGAYGKDSEMSKLYESEWAIEKVLKTKDTKIADISQAQKYVDKVTSSKTWQKVRSNRRSNVKVVAMKNASGGCAAMAWGGLIQIKSDHLDKYIILHELAHEAGHMHHGRSFRQCLLKLVGQFLGRDVADALKVQFKKRKLAFGDGRKPLSFDQWIVRRQRMEAMRNG